MTSSTDLRVGGLARLSSVDWPGELAATVFLQGCPWRCPYCHNPHLLQAGAGDGPPWPEVMAFLAGRVGLLDGVVFSGGEPTVQRALADAVAEVRALGFRVAVHTGGPDSERFRAVLAHVDWVGFDVKAPWQAYPRITGVEGSGAQARESLAALVDSRVPFEARTTIHPDLLGVEDLELMADELVAAGVRRWVLQPFRAEGTSGALPSATLDARSTERRFAERFEHFSIR